LSNGSDESVAIDRPCTGLDCCSPLAAWAFGALFFDFPVVTLRAPTAIVFVLVLIGVVIWLPGKLLKLVAVFGGFGLVTSWWLILKPTNGNTTGFQT